MAIHVCAKCGTAFEMRGEGDNGGREVCFHCWRGGWRVDAYGNISNVRSGEVRRPQSFPPPIPF